jgi:hypothetical protein
MLVRVTGWVLRISALLALILGILLWVKVLPDSSAPIHMLLGIIVVLSLIVLAVAFGTAKGGNWGLAGGAIVLAIIVAGFGGSQQTILPSHSIHWLIQVIHLLLGLAAIGMGEAIAGRYRRIQKATQTA